VPRSRGGLARRRGGLRFVSSRRTAYGSLESIRHLPAETPHARCRRSRKTLRPSVLGYVAVRESGKCNGPLRRPQPKLCIQGKHVLMQAGSTGSLPAQSARASDALPDVSTITTCLGSCVECRAASAQAFASSGLPLLAGVRNRVILGAKARFFGAPSGVDRDAAHLGTPWQPDAASEESRSCLASGREKGMERKQAACQKLRKKRPSPERGGFRSPSTTLAGGG
jgi:hypothetical protein